MQFSPDGQVILMTDRLLIEGLRYVTHRGSFQPKTYSFIHVPSLSSIVMVALGVMFQTVAAYTQGPEPDQARAAWNESIIFTSPCTLNQKGSVSLF
jgi:uncharacterized membrane protein YjgN (DUF898 family)